MSNLRWIERDGRQILQQSYGVNYTEWADVPTHQEPKKVTVTTELQRHFNTLFDESQGESLTSFGYAAAAIEFFKARMLKELSGCHSTDVDYGYTQALKDVRQALFGEA